MSRILLRVALGPIATFSALLVAMWLLAVQGNTFIVFLYGVGLVFATATLGLHVLVNDGGDISLSQGGQIAVGAFVGAHLFTLVPEPLGPAFLLVGSTLAGAISGAIVSIPMLRLRGLAVAVGTLVLNAAIFNFVLRLPEFVGGSGGLRLRPAAWLPANDFEAVVWLTVISTVTIVVTQLLRRGRFGLGLRAIRANDDLARSAGVPVAWYRMAAYTVAGATAGIAGAMWVILHHGIAPSAFTEASSLVLLTLALLGGRGSTVGPLTAAIALGVLTGLLGGFGIVVSFFAPAALVFVLIKHPDGLNEQLALVAHGLRALVRRFVAGGGAVPRAVDPAADGRAADARVAAEDQDGSGRVDEPAGPGGDGRDGLAVLRCSDMDVAFGGLMAVSRVTVGVNAGEVLALMGPNGAGKTTLLNALSGHIRPSRGTIWLAGSDITHTPAHRRAARGLRRTFQLRGHMPSESGLDHLRLGTRGQRTASSREADAIIDTTARRLGLSRDDLAARVGDLPAGTAKLVEIGMALANRGHVLLLDEPTVGLTAPERRRLAATLRSLADGGLAVVLVDHDTAFIKLVADRVVALNAGHIIARGGPDQVFADSAFITAYLGSSTAHMQSSSEVPV